MAGLPACGYVICTEQRWGSTNLSQPLGSTGQPGRPREYFNAISCADKAIRTIRRRRRNSLAGCWPWARPPNDVYGLTAPASQFDHAVPPRWASRLPNLSFVFLQRRDLLGQALSHARALHTGQYHSHRPLAVEPVYDRAAINNSLVDWRTTRRAGGSTSPPMG